MEIKYEDFCRETKCFHYNLISRLSSTLNMREYPYEAKRSLEIARVHCKQDCERTAYQFYQWLKQKGLTDVISKFD